VERIVHHDADTLLAVAETEGAAKLYLIAESLLGNQSLQSLHDLTGPLDMTGASDTNCNFHNCSSHFISFYFII
jgi:hypothetical protein